MTIKYLDSKRISLENSMSIDGLKAYYKFDEATGNILNKATSIGSTVAVASSDLVVTGATRGVTGKLGKALSFDGSGDYVQATSAGTTGFNFMHQDGATFTVLSWYKVDAFTAGTNLIGTEQVSGSESGFLFALRHDDRKFDIFIGKSDSDLIDFSNSVQTPNDTDWHMLMVKYDDATGTVSASIDNGTVATSTGHNLTNTSNQANYFTMGADGATNGSWNGDIDETSIWNRVLTSAEITTIYNSGNGLEIRPAKPTNVQDNSILVEKDTGRRYWFDADPTGTTTKTYDHYTSTGSQFDGLFTGNIIRGGIKIVSGSPAINTYIQKVKLSVKKLGSPSGNLTITVRDDSDTILASGTLANSSITTSYADYEITLDSAVKLAINYRVMGEYSGGDSSNNLIMEQQQTTIETGYENTKYNGSAYSSYGTGYRPSFTFDSTPASITLPATWTMNPTMSNDVYGSSSGWDLSSSTDITLDTANKGVTLGDVDETNGIGRGLGFTASNDKWLLRFKFEISELHGNDHGQAGITSDHTLNFKTTSLESLTAMVQGASYWRFVLLKNDQGSYVEDTSASNAFSLNTTYYIEMIRDGDTVTETIRTGSHSGSVVDTLSVSGLTSGFTLGLDGIQHWSYSNTSEYETGWVRNVEFYNGVTTPN